MNEVENVYTYTASLMGIDISLKLFEANKTIITQIFNTIKILENLLTVNKKQSEVMSVNNLAGKEPVTVNSIVFNLIRIAKNISLLENNCFNFTIGPLVKLWKIGFAGNRIPDANKIKELLLLTDPKAVSLNLANKQVFLEKTGMEIDLGAIAKGYIADIIKDTLIKNNIHNAIINLGGNIFALGKSLQDNLGYWHIGLQKPFAAEENLIGIIGVINKSVVTSGIYERFFEVENKIYHHILNPKTGYPLDNELESVTIISNRSIDGDIFSTIFYGWGVTAGLEYAKQLVGIDVIFVTKNKQVILSNTQNYTFKLLDYTYKVMGLKQV